MYLEDMAPHLRTADVFSLTSWFVFVVMISTSFTRASFYDPHLFPKTGPFFEGWYLRLTDADQNRSLALLFGTVLPHNPLQSQRLAFVGFLLGLPGKPLQSFNAFPDVKSVKITVKNGKAVVKNPDKKPPAHFRWEVPSVGFIEVRENSSAFNWTVEGVTFVGDIGAPVLWDDTGDGPEGWLGDLPLPLHWFVYSLRSPLLSYEWINRRTGETLVGRHQGSVHMEKNWGASFPTAWVWTQAVKSPSSNVSYVLSYGPVDFGIVTINGHLAGYRNPEKDISLSFNPSNSLATVQVNGCNHSIYVEVSGLFHKLFMNITSQQSSFSECLYGPEKNGFRKVCSESYQSSVILVVKKRFLWMDKTIDQQVFYNAAMEFGGNFVCNQECTKNNFL